MPSKNSVKQYSENSYYHIYNRGVEKRLIYQDEQDYGVFLGYLKEYLTPKNEDQLRKALSESSINSKQKDKLLKLLRLNNFSNEITLLTYGLIPNHFHLLIKQKGANSIHKFIQSLCTRYTMYFNRKYKRVGSLFQAVYKAVLIVTNEQLLYLNKYIHKQTHKLKRQQSSLLDYLGKRKTLWINTEEILSFFAKNNKLLSYENFIEENDDFNIINDYIIEE